MELARKSDWLCLCSSFKPDNTFSLDIRHAYGQGLPESLVTLEICITNPGFDWEL